MPKDTDAFGRPKKRLPRQPIGRAPVWRGASPTKKKDSPPENPPKKDK